MLQVLALKHTISSVFFCWFKFSVIYRTVLLRFLTHLVPDHTALGSRSRESWLITSTTELGERNGRTLTPPS